eukprot:NP_510330.1 Uncharacterized protein CELE_C31E10.1 [Caenorhabditis elegans]
MALFFWRDVLEYFKYFCVGCSVFLNTVLIILVLFRSPHSLGFYKYLMTYIYVFDLFYAVWDIITNPTVYSYGPAFVVFRNYDNSMFTREMSFYMVLVYCGCFAFSLACFGVHFMYRYGTVNNDFRERFLSGKKIYIIFAVPILCGSWWSVISGVAFCFDEYSDEYLSQLNPICLIFRDAVKNDLNFNISSLASMVIFFYLPDENGKLHPHWKTFLVMTSIYTITFVSIFSVIFCGFKCYNCILQAMSITTVQSKISKSLQHHVKSIFHTLIPMVLMYIPLFFVFALPLFNINFPYASTAISATISIYLAIDPLPSMFIIKAYRKAVLGKLTNKLDACIIVFQNYLQSFYR